MACTESRPHLTKFLHPQVLFKKHNRISCLFTRKGAKSYQLSQAKYSHRESFRNRSYTSVHQWSIVLFLQRFARQLKAVLQNRVRRAVCFNVQRSTNRWYANNLRSPLLGNLQPRMKCLVEFKVFLSGVSAILHMWCVRKMTTPGVSIKLYLENPNSGLCTGPLI